MDVKSQYAWWRVSGKRNNNPLLPRNIRGLIIGKSNCGKTTVLLNLLLRSDWLHYNHLYIFGNSLHQQEYKILRKGYESGLSKKQISNVFVNQDKLTMMSPLQAIDEYTKQNGVKTSEIKTNFYDDCKMIPDPAELDVEEKNLLILDDCFLGKQNKAEAYYTRGRHNNCDTFYISQNYFRLPRHTISENANFILLFPQDCKNLNHIHADHCQDITLEEFKRFCQTVWRADKHNFVTIDLSSQKLNGKYRENFDRFYLPSTNG